jgi:soluble lytic murein transglycosylase
VRYWLAEGAVRRGDKDSAIPVWERIWTANPTSPAATLAAKRLADAGRPVPDPSSEAGQALIRARMKSFERLRMFPEALALRDRLPSAPVSAPKGLAAEAQAAFDAKDYPRAVSLFAKLPSPSAQQRFNHALATSRAGDYPGAAALYTRLYQAEPGAALADQASFKIGYLSYDAGDLGQAVPLLQAHLRRYPSSRYADEARWFIGWSLYRLGKKADASAAFSDLISKDPKSELAIGAVYWRARIADQGGDSASAKKGYETVLRSWPLSGYAWFASRRLGQSAEVAARSPNPPVPATLAALPGFAEGRALAAVGLHSWARDRLLPLVATARSASAESQNALAAALIEAGAYRAGQDLVRARCPRPGAGDPTLQQLCWPEPMGAAVHGAATRYGLPAGLPFAIMTAESALDPEVTSMAGARGLMQLMPALAAQHAPEVYPGRPWNPDNLYDPGINARLGVHELGGLWASFQSRSVQPALPMVIAGYNAGSAAVERWLGEAAPGTEADEWAENIGYTETRRYVRRVLGYLRAYELIYGG